MKSRLSSTVWMLVSLDRRSLFSASWGWPTTPARIPAAQSLLEWASLPGGASGALLAAQSGSRWPRRSRWFSS